LDVMAAHAGLLLCDVCRLLNRRHGSRSVELCCARCATPLHPRKPNSIAWTWALLVTAYLAYIPANVLPVLVTESILEHTSDTILGGAVRLWAQGAWPLAVVIIVASFVVPLAKLFALTWLLVSVKSGSTTDTARRTRLYRAVDLIGRWSMVDIYVGGLLVALIQFQPFATVAAGPAAIAFAAVVVLTMMASRTFDPRLLWDAGAAAPARLEPRHG
jgi:paraquat-inducible protein A